MDITQRIRRVFDVEIQELCNVRDAISGNMDEIVNLIYQCEGKVVICGMGKPGHIGRKISATMSSLGISSYFLHPAEGLHGDLGTLSSKDIIMIFSNSGETSEICNMLPNIKIIGATIVGITSVGESTLGKYSDYKIVMPRAKEACALDLAPTSSTTAQLVVGDALAVVVSELREFSREKYAVFHPSGALGKKLNIRVSDIMHTGNDNPVVPFDCMLPEAINEMTKKGLGAISITDSAGLLCGIITDGDLRRAMNKKLDIYNSTVQGTMTAHPVTVKPELLAVDALRIMEMRNSQISVLPVINDQNEPIGIIRNHDIIKQNIFL